MNSTHSCLEISQLNIVALKLGDTISEEKSSDGSPKSRFFSFMKPKQRNGSHSVMKPKKGMLLYWWHFRQPSAIRSQQLQTGQWADKLEEAAKIFKKPEAWAREYKFWYETGWLLECTSTDVKENNQKLVSDMVRPYSYFYLLSKSSAFSNCSITSESVFYCCTWASSINLKIDESKLSKFLV